jgi:AraC-like DNA-binding protein
VEALIEASRERAPSLEQVARRVHLSARTLIRRLRRAGTTYHGLLDVHRRASAEVLLKNPDFDVAEVSHRLGYGDPANFGRACRRWFGMAPGRYRRLHAP